MFSQTCLKGGSRELTIAYKPQLIVRYLDLRLSPLETVEARVRERKILPHNNASLIIDLERESPRYRLGINNRYLCATPLLRYEVSVY